MRIAALRTLREAGIEQAWRKYWVPLFSSTADAQTVAAAERIALAQPPEALARGITAFHTRPSRDNFLATFPRPILFVTGADDVAPGPETSAAQTAAVPQGSLHVVPDCGHYVPLERPEALNAILYKLVADTAGCFENDQKATAY